MRLRHVVVTGAEELVRLEASVDRIRAATGWHATVTLDEGLAQVAAAIARTERSAMAL